MSLRFDGFQNGLDGKPALQQYTIEDPGQPWNGMSVWVPVNPTQADKDAAVARAKARCK